MASLKVVGVRCAVVAGVCAGAFAWTAGPSLAVGGSDPPLFTESHLSVDAGGSWIQDRPFEFFGTGVNEAPGGNQSGLVPYRFSAYVLSAKVATCPMTNAGMELLVKQHPQDTKIAITSVPEPATGGTSVDGPFTIPLLQATPGNIVGPIYICGYSTYAGEDAAWDQFGPVTITRPLPTASFPSRSVRLGTTGGCWPLAQTTEEKTQGLTGVRHPARPMLFPYKQAGSHSFSLLGVLTGMSGIWIGHGHKVIGRWHGAADSGTIQKPPAPVTDVALYPAGQRLPANGAHLQIGASCHSSATL